MLDPHTHAVRRDIADVRLAERVFAPHYAAPMTRKLAASGTLRETGDHDAPVLARMAAGDVFEVLEIVGTCAWGIAPRIGRVGYIDTAALEGFSA